tara:strand:+ start:313 stop:435 length:123 start_codon:yes stop_codon:yes gene_type:complete
MGVSALATVVDRWVKPERCVSVRNLKDYEQLRDAIGPAIL